MDVTVTRIINAYHVKTSNWKRKNPAPRKYEGIVIFEEGCIEYRFGEEIIVAKAGDILLLPSGIPYTGKMLSETVAYFVIDIECSREGELRVTAPSSRRLERFDRSKAKALSAVSIWQKQSIDASLHVKAIVYELLCEYVRVLNTNKSTAPTSEIVEYILENLNDPALSVKGLCEHFYISESQLRRNIVKQTGARPNEYILKLRLNQAKAELLYTQKSIQQISAECGFTSPYYFSRCFSAELGVSPTEYRQGNI